MRACRAFCALFLIMPFLAPTVGAGQSTTSAAQQPTSKTPASQTQQATDKSKGSTDSSVTAKPTAPATLENSFRVSDFVDLTKYTNLLNSVTPLGGASALWAHLISSSATIPQIVANASESNCVALQLPDTWKQVDKLYYLSNQSGATPVPLEVTDGKNTSARICFDLSSNVRFGTNFTNVWGLILKLDCDSAPPVKPSVISVSDTDRCSFDPVALMLPTRISTNYLAPDIFDTVAKAPDELRAAVQAVDAEINKPTISIATEPSNTSSHSKTIGIAVSDASETVAAYAMTRAIHNTCSDQPSACDQSKLEKDPCWTLALEADKLAQEERNYALSGLKAVKPPSAPKFETILSCSPGTEGEAVVTLVNRLKVAAEQYETAEQNRAASLPPSQNTTPKERKRPAKPSKSGAAAKTTLVKPTSELGFAHLESAVVYELPAAERLGHLASFQSETNSNPRSSPQVSGQQKAADQTAKSNSKSEKPMIDSLSKLATALAQLASSVASVPPAPMSLTEIISMESGTPQISQSWLRNNEDTYQLFIGGEPLHPWTPASSSGGPEFRPVPLQNCQRVLNVELYQQPSSCREYQPDGPALSLTINLPAAYDPLGVCSSGSVTSADDPFGLLDNGITVGHPKIYDTFGLRKLFNTTASQLASINPISASAIINAYGTLQGVQRDTSYLALQATTVPGATTVTNSLGQTQTTQATTPLTTQTSSSQTYSCPSGTAAQYTTSSSGSVSVTCVPSAASTGTGLTVSSSGSSGPTTTGPSTVVTTGQPTQNVQTTQNGVGGSVPVAPASTALSVPSATSVSSADMLAEQMQLSSQLTILQMLLQGADSDRLMVAGGHAVGIRKQTTISFPITLRPPAPYKHAVAEVRVLMIPRRRSLQAGARMDVVNLLPSEKTYNVAKITSKQRAFGAGVVIEPVSVGVNTGKAKDRMYIAKDTDTVALQYPTEKFEGLPSDWPARIGPWAHNFFLDAPGKRDEGGSCTALLPSALTDPSNNALRQATWDFSSAVMFGWQFRPVLGADYVASNVRNVFAQLALPEDQSSNEGLEVDVFIQTRWRTYNMSGQVTGPSVDATCQWTHLDDSIAIDNPIKVKNVEVDDTGNGVLRFRAQGDLLSSSFNVRNGASTIPPQFFDGRHIEFFANALDVLHNGDMQLVSEDGAEIPLKIESPRNMQCSINDAHINAIPRPDGTAAVLAHVSRGSNFSYHGVNGEHSDGEPHYKILIGSTVYGLLESPFLSVQSDADSPSSVYRFEAAAADLHTARTFLIRDLAWDPYGRGGTIDFAPTFSSMTAISQPSSVKTPPGAAGAKKAAAPSITWYEVRGADLLQIKDLPQFSADELDGKTQDTLLIAANDGTAEWPVLDQAWVPNVPDPQRPCPAATKWQSPCDSGSLRPILRVIDNTTVRLGLYKASGEDASPPSTAQTTIHFLWNTPELGPIDWPLKLSSPSSVGSSAIKITSDPPFLNRFDSRAVKFTSADNSVSIGCFVSATAESGTVSQVTSTTTPGPVQVHNAVTLEITSAITGTPGYKEITLKYYPLDKFNPSVCARTGAKTTTVGLQIVGANAAMR